MRYLHTMLRVRNLDAALDFYLQQARPEGGAPPGRREEQVHAGVPGGAARTMAARRKARGAAGATRRWSNSPTTGTPRTTARRAISAISPTRSTTSTRPARSCMKAGVTINRPPRDGNMAFVRSPDQHSIELLQKGAAAAAEGAVGLDAEYREMVKRRRRRAACLPPRGERSLYRRAPCTPASSARASCALRLAVQDIALSRRKHGFDSRRARQLRLRMRQKCNAAEQTTEALAWNPLYFDGRRGVSAVL